jgi:WD40 repeat protein
VSINLCVRRILFLNLHAFIFLVVADKGKVYSALTCGNDNLVKIWQLTLWKKNTSSHQCAVEMVQSLKGHSSTVTSVCFCGGDATLFATTSMDKTTRIWQVTNICSDVYWSFFLKGGGIKIYYNISYLQI